jgi:hypothetical protein
MQQGIPSLAAPKRKTFAIQTNLLTIFPLVPNNVSPDGQKIWKKEVI